MFLFYVVKIKHQQMSHAITYNNFCKDITFQHLALVQLKCVIYQESMSSGNTGHSISAKQQKTLIAVHASLITKTIETEPVMTEVP
jgi:hypothetical protein